MYGGRVPHPDDLERLADRLAMIVSDDGEAGNAGIAAAHLARRMGLTGGELKAMLLSGGAEVAGLRHIVAQLDFAVQRAESEAKLLRDAGERLHDELDRANSMLRLHRVAAVMVVAVAVVAAAAVVAPRIGGPVHPAAAGLATTGLAATRVPNAELHREPDQSSALLARLPVGAKVVVRRVVWHTLSQWAEVEVDGQTGYVSANDVTLP